VDMKPIDFLLCKGCALSNMLRFSLPGSIKNYESIKMFRLYHNVVLIAAKKKNNANQEVI